MIEALLIGAAVLIVAAFIGGVVLGRSSAGLATGAPTDVSAAVQVQSAAAEDKAAADATAATQAKAAKVMRESDAEIAARVAALREKGKAGE